MTRDARLYFLTYKDWEPLVQQIEAHRNATLKDLVLVFDLFTGYPKEHYYAILSLHNDIDRIVEDYGCVEADEKNLMRTLLHEHHDDPVYGDKSLLVFLNKVLPITR